MARTYRMKTVAYPYGDPTWAVNYFGFKSLRAYMADFYGDKRSGRRNAPKGARKDLEATRRNRAKMELYKAVNDENYDASFDPIRHDVNEFYW